MYKLYPRLLPVFIFLCIAVGAMLVPLLAFAQSSTTSKTIGCTYWVIPNTSAGVTDPNNKNEVCRDGICVTYDIPNCGECEIEVCYGAEEFECEDAACSPVHFGDPVPTNFIPCDTSRHVATRCRGIGNPQAYVCTVPVVCANCDWHSWVDPYMQAWESGNWVTTGGVTFRCDCDADCCTPI